MPRKATGSAFKDRAGRWYVQVTLAAGPKGRPAFALPVAFTEEQADARRVLLADLAARLREKKIPRDVAEQLLEKGAAADTDKRLAGVLNFAEEILSGDVPLARPLDKRATFRDVAKRWTSSELARDYADHVSPMREGDARRVYIERHLLPAVGDVEIASFTLDHADRAMQGVPSTLAPSTRGAIAGALFRVLALAVFPLRLIAANPIPREWRPKTGARRVRPYLYPEEDRTLLACVRVPLESRLLYGFLAREGMRYSEARALDWGALDLERGSVRLDVNKTDDPRAWALGSDVVRALRLWKAMREKRLGRAVLAGEPVFTLTFKRGAARIGGPDARRFRKYLRRAGLTREELDTTKGLRRPIRVHDLRGTFVTLTLATGRTETWVADRTGHKSSGMINRYRRAARTATELHLGWLVALDEAIPELTGNANGNASGGGRSEHEEREKKSLPAHVAALRLRDLPHRAVVSPCDTNRPRRS